MAVLSCGSLHLNEESRGIIIGQLNRTEDVGAGSCWGSRNMSRTQSTQPASGRISVSLASHGNDVKTVDKETDIIKPVALKNDEQYRYASGGVTATRS